MSGRYLKADVFRLEVLLDLVDRYWRGETDLAPQIRLEGDSFALSPLARRRLEWEVRDHHETEEPVAASGGAAPRARPTRPKGDPRKLLHGDFS